MRGRVGLSSASTDDLKPVENKGRKHELEVLHGAHQCDGTGVWPRLPAHVPHPQQVLRAQLTQGLVQGSGASIAANPWTC